MKSHTINGIPLSTGSAEGTIWHVQHGRYRHLSKDTRIAEAMVATEIGRMRQAVQVVSLVMEHSIDQVAQRLGQQYADIFVALREMLHDPSILDSIQTQISSEHFSARSAITKVFSSFRNRLSDAPSGYLNDRATDLTELQDSLLDALQCDSESGTAHAQAGAQTIAAVQTLTTRLVLDFKNTKVRGIICELAGPTSHAAILCRAFRIPAVAGVKKIQNQLPQNNYAIIDGASGTIHTALHRHEIVPFTNTAASSNKKVFTDLSQIILMANLSLAQNALSTLTAGAQGIGLYRTEFEFMFDNRLLSQQEQFLRYRTVVIAMMGFPVTIRLLDISIDKTAEVFDALSSRLDPANCGAEFLLSQPDLVKKQAGAIIEAAQFGPVRVVYPMVADAYQFMQLRNLFFNAVGIELAAKLKHGAMIELPSAVQDAEAIAAAADFVCLGTNDLIQHTLNINREAATAHTAEIVQAPALWDAIAKVAGALQAAGKELTICGEMASNLDVLPRFIDLGIRTFSMDIQTIRQLKKGRTK